MNKNVIITLWLASFVVMVLTANSLSILFWLSFVAFVFTSNILKRLSESLNKYSNENIRRITSNEP